MDSALLEFLEVIYLSFLVTVPIHEQVIYLTKRCRPQLIMRAFCLLENTQEAAQMLGGLHPNTLRQRKAGTERLTHVRGFGKRVMLLREEVSALVELKIAQRMQLKGTVADTAAGELA